MLAIRNETVSGAEQVALAAHSEGIRQPGCAPTTWGQVPPPRDIWTI